MEHITPTSAQAELLADIDRVREQLKELQLKIIASSVGTDIELAASFPRGIDRRWLSIGTTHLQEGFMAWNRAIISPDVF